MSNRQVLIGLVAQHNNDHPNHFFLARAYSQAIINAGGIPLIIPHQPPKQLASLLSQVRGVVLTGGVDVDPQRYGEEPHPGCGEISPLRDELDFAVADWALRHDLPLLAICRGIQVLNVALGGTLFQDIPAQVAGALKHRQQAPGWYGTHEVQLEPATLLSSIWGGSLKVNSLHHQAIKRLGTGLRLAATASDGVIEAVESTEHRFVVGVQWHPELMEEHCPAARELFRKFVEAAAAD